jgi:hypothetical protein
MICPNNIEQIRNDSQSAIYKTSCHCNDSEHDLTIWIDKPDDIFETTIFFNVCGPYPYTWKGETWLKRLWKRIYWSLRILFTGHAVFQEAFIFRDKNHVQDFIDALQEAIR